MANRLHFQFASSLFLELRATMSFSSLVKPTAPILCLTGDIVSPYSKITDDFFKYCNTHWDKVLWVPGYHELAPRKHLQHQTMDDSFDKMKEIAHLYNRVLPMYNTVWKDTTSSIPHVFLGTPLWGRGHTHSIRFHLYANRQSTTKRKVQTFELHDMVTKNMSWLDGHIEEANELNERAIVLTYSPPSLSCITGRDFERKNWMINHMPSLIRRPVAAWVVGDLYECFQLNVHKGYECKQPCLLVSNSLKDISNDLYRSSRSIMFLK